MLAPAAAALDARLGWAANGDGVFVALTNSSASDVLDVAVLVRAGDREGKGSAGRVVAGRTHVVWVGLADLAPGDGAATPAAARIDWRSAGAAADAAPLSTVVTALLGAGRPGLGIEVEPLVVESTATLRVRVSSLDGRARQVGLDVLAPAGLLLLPPAPIAVPASGAAVAEVTVIRGSAPRGAVLEVALLARGAEAAGLARARIELAPELGLLRHFRSALVVAALALFAAAALWRRSESSAGEA